MKPPKTPNARDTLFSYLLGSEDVAGKKIVDLFAGGGGVSLGVELALGRSPDVAINHDEEAIAMHQHNHPHTRHYQTDVFEVDPFEAVGDSPVALLWLSPDCFPAGTLVLTERGYVPIETVQVGERVLTHALRWKRVTETSRTQRPLMTIRGYGHPGLAVSPEHPFLARSEKHGKGVWTPASVLNKGHYWATPTIFGTKCLHAPLIGGRGLKLDEHLFWLAGQYLSNGWTRLTEDRAELVITTHKGKADGLREQLSHWARKGARSGAGELAWHERETETAYQFATNHQGLVQWLRDNFGHRAEGKTLPGWVYQLPAHEREALLRGYLQGDGSSSETVQECSTVSKALAFSIKSLAESLGKSVTVFLSSNPDTIQGRPVNALPIYQVRWRHQLKREHTVRHEGLEWAPIREVTAPEGLHTVYNIGVEDDESYVVEGIIVHNCKHHSRAKGGRPLDQKIRSLAWVGLKWAGKVRPDVIILENVPDFQHWGRLVAQRGLTEVQPDGKVKKVLAPWPNKPKRRGKACRRWKRGMAAQQRPRGPIMTDEEGNTLLVADKRKRYRGRSFRHFKRELERLGYTVEHRVLRADEYGVPTIRERFFLVARCDGKAIHWPEPTHGTDRQPVRTAAECIDWSLPTRTIFERHARRNTDLAPATLRRVAMGVDKYVLGTAQPFLVQCNHSGGDNRQRSLHEPMLTVTSSRDAHGVVTPFLAPMNFDNAPEAVTRPLSTVTTQGNRHVIVEPQLAPFLAPRYGERDGQAPRCGTVDAPLPTVVTSANGARLAVAHITKFRAGSTGSPADEPLHTVTAGGNPARPSTGNVHGLVAAHIVRHNGGGLAPQHAGYAADEPARTITAQGGPQALVSAALVQYNAANDAQPLSEPCRTVSTRDRYALMQASMLRIDNQGWCQDATVPADHPLRTVTTKNGHALMTAHVLRQFGTSDARPVNEPLASITAGATKDGVITTHLAPGLDTQTLTGARRVFAFLREYCPAALDRVPAEDRAQELVTLVLGGEKFVIWDIGMRMLEPRELYRCQGFPDTYSIDFSLKGKPLGKAAQVRMCGNSVPPPLVAALVGAQFSAALEQAAD